APAPASGGGWWFPHETAPVAYNISVSPPPLDVSKVEIHSGGHDGPIVRTIANLEQTPGAHSLPLQLRDFTPVREKSPLALDFTFSKSGAGGRHAMAIAARAEPAPLDIRAEPANHTPGTRVNLSVARWGALVHDGGGADPREEEITPERATQIPSDVKQQVKWRIVAQGL